MIVRWKNQAEASADHRQHRDQPELLRQDAMPKTSSGRLPVKAGTNWVGAPIVVTAPRSRIEKPMVMSTDCAMVACRAGRSAVDKSRRRSRRKQAPPGAPEAYRQAGAGEHGGEHRAQHGEIALREIDDAGAAIDQAEAEPDKGVERSVCDASKNRLAEANEIHDLSCHPPA